MTTIAETHVKFVSQAEIIAKQRYYLRDDENEIMEDSPDLFRRVARAVSAIEDNFFTLSV